MPNALASCKKAVSKLLRLQMHIAVHLLEPLHAVTGRALKFESFNLPLLLEVSQRRLDVSFLRGQSPSQSDGVFHGKLCAGADTEMRGMRGIADQDDVFMKPFLAEDTVEPEPDSRPAQMMSVRN